MPIYEYRCSTCDHLTEVIHGINDPGPRFCESCGAEGTMRKGFGAPAVLFKGSGWARKERGGSRSSSSSSSKQSESGGSSNGSTDSASKGDTASKSGTSGSSDD
jgi:putative FmdB family regulatory protein